MICLDVTLILETDLGEHSTQFLTQKNIQKFNLLARWLHNMGRGWPLKTFKFASHKKVCEDQFTSTSFNEDLETCRGVVPIIVKNYLLLRIAVSLPAIPLNSINAT